MNKENVYQRSAKAQKIWATIPVAQRAQRFIPALEMLDERVDEFAAIIHQENGKPLLEAVSHEIGASLVYLKWVISQAPKLLGDEPRALSVFPHRKATIERVPWGTVLVIGPWNVPLYIPLSQVIPALIAGNAVVLKPSEITPKSASILQELLHDCCLPDGLFQIIEGDGKVGAKLIKDKPDKVLFTGSVATGRKVMAACAKHPIPVTLELGGVDAMIVLEDANLEFASSAAAWGATFNGGQVCSSVERLLVAEPIRENFMSLLIDKLERIHPEQDLGPITFSGQKKIYESHLADARERELDVPIGGHFIGNNRFAPTLITGDGITESAVWNQETFGPILAATEFSTDDEAIDLHNSISSGLTASVFSSDPTRARRIASKLRAGLVAINEVGATLYSQPELPWGGVGKSGFGRSHGAEGLVDCTWPRVIEENRFNAPEPKRPWWYPYGTKQLEMMQSFGRAQVAGSRMKQLSEVVKVGRAAAKMLVRTPRM
jgi:succinate-semialdehyde dehydrogenase/glutarate-semialdehyde dehydrogenase